VVALAFVPLTVLRFIELDDGVKMSTGARAALIFPAFAEAAFCLVCFWQLTRWTQWASQRRFLFFAWVIYFIAPFVVYLYPFREAFDTTKAMKVAAEIGEMHLSTKKQHLHLAVGLVFGVKAMLLLAPKAVSLMPGVIRASIVTKLLFPGTRAPGFLLLLAAPLYALFAYIVILLPYQITGSVFFVGGVVGVTAAQVFITLAGTKLTMPLSRALSHIRVHRYWLAYIGLLVLSLVSILIGAIDFVRELEFGVVSVASTVVSFFANVLVLTLIGTDSIIANLHRLTRLELDEHQETLRKDSSAKLDRFCR
jgi:hypothetical protein